MFKVILIILSIFNILSYTFGEYETCKIELGNIYILDGTYDDNFNRGPSFDDLKEKGVNIDINYDIHNYGYDMDDTDYHDSKYVVEYKIMMMFYDMHFKNDEFNIIRDIKVIRFPKPTEFCSYYSLYSENNFRIYDLKLYDDCFSALIVSGFNYLLTGVQNIFLGPYVDFTGLNIGFLQDPTENLMELGYDIYFNFYEENYGVKYPFVNPILFNELQKHIGINYKIYLTLYYLNVHLYVNEDKRKCASPTEFCLNYPHYLKIKFQSTDLDTYYSCLNNLNSYYSNQDDPVSIFNEFNMINYLLVNHLNFDKNFEKPYYGCTLPKTFYLEYQIHIMYYVVHTKTKESHQNYRKITSINDFCYNRNFFMSRGFRTPSETYLECLEVLCSQTSAYKYHCNENGIQNINIGPHKEVLKANGMDLTNKINEKYFGIKSKIAIGKKYKLVLVYYSDIVLPKHSGNNNIKIRVASPREFCFDLEHYKKVNFKTPYRDHETIDHLTYNQVPIT